jgi:hypothetical protein
LVFLVNYAYYATLLYYEKVLWEFRNALYVFQLFLMGKTIVTYEQLELRPALVNELSA